MILLNGIVYSFKGNFPIKFITSFFKMFLVLPLYGYMVRIAQNVSKGDESGLPEGAFGSELGLGLGLFVLELPIYIIGQTILNATAGVSQSFIAFDPESLEGVAIQVFIQLAVTIIVIGIFSFIITLRWIVTGNYFAAFNLKATWDYLQEHRLKVISGYIQYIAVWLLFPIIFVGGGLLATQTLWAICGILLLIPLPFLVRAYVIGKVAQETKMRVVEADKGEIFEDIEE